MKKREKPIAYPVRPNGNLQPVEGSTAKGICMPEVIGSKMWDGIEENNNPGGTKPVGQLLENELGIHDLSGNVYEWCEDDFHSSYRGAPLDGSAWIDQPKRGAVAVSCAVAFGSPLVPACRVS